MRISRTRQLTINMGNYGERYQAGATVTLDHQDLGYSNEQWAEVVQEEGLDSLHREMSKLALTLVNRDLEAEVSEVLAIRDPEEPSFIEAHEPPEPPEKPAKRRRRN